jgi:hypothetical protein
MSNIGTHRKTPRRSRCNEPEARSEREFNRNAPEVEVKALPKKEIERRLRYYENLRD